MTQMRDQLIVFTSGLGELYTAGETFQEREVYNVGQVTASYIVWSLYLICGTHAAHTNPFGLPKDKT